MLASVDHWIILQLCQFIPGCIFTYKGHSQQVNSLKFSPDGQWVASAGEEGAVKVKCLGLESIEFYDMFTTSLQALTFQATNMDVNYLIGNVTFRYDLYKFV